jgi:hypothetical protein
MGEMCSRVRVGVIDLWGGGGFITFFCGVFFITGLVCLYCRPYDKYERCTGLWT